MSDDEHDVIILEGDPTRQRGEQRDAPDDICNDMARNAFTLACRQINPLPQTRSIPSSPYPRSQSGRIRSISRRHHARFRPARHQIRSSPDKRPGRQGRHAGLRAWRPPVASLGFEEAGVLRIERRRWASW